MKYAYQQSAMFLAHRIAKTLGQFHGWSFGYCLSQAHQLAKHPNKRKFEPEAEVLRLASRAQGHHRVHIREASARKLTNAQYWKLCYAEAWKDMSKGWRYRAGDDNPNIRKAVRARIKQADITHRLISNSGINRVRI